MERVLWSQRWDGIWEVEVGPGAWRSRLGGVVAALSRDARAWMVVDPMDHLAGLCARDRGLVVYSPASPRDIVRAVEVAVSAGVSGVALIDVASLDGLWGEAGPDTQLWRPLRDTALWSGVAVVSVCRARRDGSRS